MSHEQFWDSTLNEIFDTLKSFNRKIEFQRKEKASFDYILADLIGLSAARLTSEKNAYPTIEKAYPSLFPILEKETEDLSWLQTKANMLKYTELHNAQFRANEVNK